MIFEHILEPIAKSEKYLEVDVKGISECCISESCMNKLKETLFNLIEFAWN